MPQNGNLESLSDDFTRQEDLSLWKHVYREEGTRANQLEQLGVRGGWLRMVPYASTWYRDYRGVLLFKPVSGDFVVTTRVRIRGRHGAVPQSQFSLAGIMVRAPRRGALQPGRENYVFLSLGAADRPGSFQFEVKTTANSDSQLQITPANSGEALIQVARVGSDFVMLLRQSGGWIVHRRYRRPDFPQMLQVGLTCYTDWPSASKLGVGQHNTGVVRGGNPDLVAEFDFVRYRRPKLPTGTSIDRSSDGDLLRYFGQAAL